MKIVSIDPGTVNCGYAVWEDGKYTDFEVITYWKWS